MLPVLERSSLSWQLPAAGRCFPGMSCRKVVGSPMGPGNGDSLHKGPCDPSLGQALYGEPWFIPITPSGFIHLTELWDRGSVQEVTPPRKGCRCRTATTRTPNIPSPAAPVPAQPSGKQRLEQLQSQYLLILVKPPLKAPREQRCCSADFRAPTRGCSPPPERFAWGTASIREK